MIDEVKTDEKISVRRSCGVLGFRRQTYYRRRQGHRPEELDQVIAELLHQITKRFIAWGFWMVFHYLRRQGHRVRLSVRLSSRRSLTPKPGTTSGYIVSGKLKNYIYAFHQRGQRSGGSTWICWLRT